MKRKPQVAGTPAAKTAPSTPSGSRKPGLLKGEVTIKPGFDDLPEGFDALDTSS